MSFLIPSQNNRKFTQLNRGDLKGNLLTTRNTTFDKDGYLTLSHPSVAIMRTSDDADFDTADAMHIGDGSLFVNSDEVFSGTVETDTLSNHSGNTNAPSPGVEDDVIYFNGSTVVSDGTNVKYFDGSSTWTTISATTVSGSEPTVLGLFDFHNSLMVGIGNKVDLINTSWGLTRTLILPSQYKVSSMVSNGSVAYIGTRHDASGEAQMFRWDGNATTHNGNYGVETFEIASVKNYGSSVVAIVSDGRLLRFNGGGFDELANLPVTITNQDWSNDSNDYSTVSNRGMVVDGDKIFITLSSEIQGYRNYLPEFHGGVWCFDPKVGLYHRHGHSTTYLENVTISSADKVNTSTDTITVNTDVKTGTPVLYEEKSSGLMLPILEGKVYFAINVSSTEIKLAKTYSDALQGTAVDITATGNTSQELHIYHVNDYGQSFTDSRTSIAVLSDTMRDSRFSGRLAFTTEVPDYASTTVSDVTSLNTPAPLLPNRGHFVTPKLYVPSKEDLFQSVEIKHLKLNTDDEIHIKYRTSTDNNFPIDFRDDGVPATDKLGTWTSTTTFTTDHDLSNVVVGNEIEIVGGMGSGVLAHVSAISEASGTYTVTLDEAFQFATNTAVFRFIVDDWKRLGSITASNQDDVTGFRIDEASEFLQLKVELRGVETTIVELFVDTKSFRSTR